MRSSGLQCFLDNPSDYAIMKVSQLYKGEELYKKLIALLLAMVMLIGLLAGRFPLRSRMRSGRGLNPKQKIRGNAPDFL